VLYSRILVLFLGYRGPWGLLLFSPREVMWCDVMIWWVASYSSMKSNSFHLYDRRCIWGWCKAALRCCSWRLRQHNDVIIHKTAQTTINGITFCYTVGNLVLPTLLPGMVWRSGSESISITKAHWLTSGPAFGRAPEASHQYSDSHQTPPAQGCIFYAINERAGQVRFPTSRLIIWSNFANICPPSGGDPLSRVGHRPPTVKIRRWRIHRGWRGQGSSPSKGPNISTPLSRPPGDNFLPARYVTNRRVL